MAEEGFFLRKSSTALSFNLLLATFSRGVSANVSAGELRPSSLGVPTLPAVLLVLPCVCNPLCTGLKQKY